ncbi:hypothetical protein [Sorangium sp. So ce513]|uniref:hypothetical protein n=1 Tax=Sorangium sp. So ce513 TaxID=3133315 RepID=UPI003F5E45A3
MQSHDPERDAWVVWREAERVAADERELRAERVLDGGGVLVVGPREEAIAPVIDARQRLVEAGERPEGHRLELVEELAFHGARIVPIAKQPLGLKGEQGARRITFPFKLLTDPAGRGEHVIVGARAGDGRIPDGEPLGAESSEAVLEDDLGDVWPGKAPFEGRAAAPPGRALRDAGAVDAQVDVLVTAIELHCQAGRRLDGVEPALKRFP